MDPDSSRVLYDQYFRHPGRLIEIILKNGIKLIGVIVSFFPGDPMLNEPYIISWRLVPAKDQFSMGVDALGFRIGKVIAHAEMKEIKFLDDGSVLKLYK